MPSTQLSPPVRRGPYLTAPERLDALVGGPAYRARQVCDWLYRTPVKHSELMTNLPAALRERFSDDLWPFRVEAVQVGDAGATKKYLFRLPDGPAIEAVLMGYPDRTTLCISSQAGCALACTFCATGQYGFERHLDAGEIVAQLQWAEADLAEAPLPGAPDHVTNLVFMGMGEPLANYDRVREALRRIVEVKGMSPRRITVSTVGIVPGMRKLAGEPWKVNLAVSLHAADDTTRSRLVPVNARYPLAAVESAADGYFAATGRRVSIEWTLIDGVNDTREQAELLAPLARRLGAHVNLIPMNPTPLTEDRPSTDAHVRRFCTWLTDLGVNATVRVIRGRDIDAACGQLRATAEA